MSTEVRSTTAFEGPKQRRHQVFEAQGADAALIRGAELGLARATLQSWTAEWRRAELRSQKERSHFH
jgi:hypothetical protein